MFKRNSDNENTQSNSDTERRYTESRLPKYYDEFLRRQLSEKAEDYHRGIREDF